MTRTEYKHELGQLAKMMGKDWTDDTDEQVDMWFRSLSSYSLSQLKAACRTLSETEDFFPRSLSKFTRVLKDLTKENATLSFEERTASLSPCLACRGDGFIKLQGKLKRSNGRWLLNRDVANGGSLNSLLVRCDCGYGDARQAAWPRMPTYQKCFGDAAPPDVVSADDRAAAERIVTKWLDAFPREARDTTFARTRSLMRAQDEDDPPVYADVPF